MLPSSSGATGTSPPSALVAAVTTDQGQTYHHNSGCLAAERQQQHEKEEGERGGSIEEEHEEQSSGVVVGGKELPTLVGCRCVLPWMGNRDETEEDWCLCVRGLGAHFLYEYVSLWLQEVTLLVNAYIRQLPIYVYVFSLSSFRRPASKCNESERVAYGASIRRTSGVVNILNFPLYFATNTSPSLDPSVFHHLTQRRQRRRPHPKQEQQHQQQPSHLPPFLSQPSPASYSNARCFSAPSSPGLSSRYAVKHGPEPRPIPTTTAAATAAATIAATTALL